MVAAIIKINKMKTEINNLLKLVQKEIEQNNEKINHYAIINLGEKLIAATNNILLIDYLIDGNYDLFTRNIFNIIMNNIDSNIYDYKLSMKFKYNNFQCANHIVIKLTLKNK